MTSESMASDHFNEFADDYDRMLERGLSVSGERKEYFAQERINWLKSCMDQLSFAPQRIMDYGCGTGMTTPLLGERFHAESVVGIDPSERLIERAKRAYGSSQWKFHQSQEYQPQGEFDLTYCSGVFHHIPVAKRHEAAQYIWRSLKPGGVLAFWENNPWNPGTRYVMSRIPFDRDAITLVANEAHDLLQSSGFQVVRTDYLFIFPNSLSVFRWIEPHLSKLPLGAQYLVLARKRVRFERSDKE